MLSAGFAAAGAVFVWGPAALTATNAIDATIALRIYVFIYILLVPIKAIIAKPAEACFRQAKAGST